MTVNNPDLFLDGVWDWAMFDGCFGETRIKPTDIDGFVERKGKFLMLETKHPGVSIPDGQRIMFNSLQKTGLFSILVLWGEKNKPQKALWITSKGEKEFSPVDTDWCRKEVARWFSYAEASSDFS